LLFFQLKKPVMSTPFRTFFYILNSIIVISAFSCNASRSTENGKGRNENSGLTRVWAIDDGEKIRRDDISNALATDPNNAVWKNNSINIFGGKNEIVAFQLIIEAGNMGASNVNVTISDLKNGSSTIPGSATGPKDPFDYRGRWVELFTEHYLNITKRSPPEWFFLASAAPSAYDSGWLPDCLVPFSAPAGQGGAPFSIIAQNNQAVWVDILIPRNAEAGTYSGNAIVTVSDKTFITIPVSLKVYDFILPDSTHLKNMFGLYPQSIAARHGVVNGTKAYFDIEGRYHQMAHRHRFDLVRSVANLGDMNKYHKRYLTGSLYTSDSGYAGPGENVGNTTFSIGYGGHVPDEYGGSISRLSETNWWEGSDAWENWFLYNAPQVARHKYLFPDEPEFKGPPGAKGTGSMDTIKMQAKWTHSNPGVGKNIPALVTNKIKEDLKGYVDFWSVSSEEAVMKTTEADVLSEKAKGRQYGIYNGYRPGMGAVVTDADAVEFRVMPWIAWKYNVDQYFYWSTNFWTSLNVFVNPMTYEDRINGDGTFFYPGQDNLFPAESRNLAGPLSSIRAKNWRRGAQDYEYLWLAKQAGLEKEMTSILNSCIPTGLWEAKSQKDISWSSRGYTFDQYRRQLAERLSSVPQK
jgi:hypothetical protein